VKAAILDDLNLRWNIFVAVANFFADPPQVLSAVQAMLFAFCQIVLNTLALQVPRQRLPSTWLVLTSGAGRWIVAFLVLLCRPQLRNY
jgi:uncharacterized membrane protein